jgi:acyl-CoA synthetase (AMP-forming)/AMP-acid ligase II
MFDCIRHLPRKRVVRLSDSLTALAPLTIDGMLRHSADRWGDRTAIVDGATRCSYRELHTRSQDVRRGFQRLGVIKGDRVAIWLPNRLEWALAFFGAVSAGAVVVPINTALSVDEALYQVEQSGSLVIVVATSFRGRSFVADALVIAERANHAVRVVALDAGDESDPSDEVVAWSSIERAGQPGTVPVEIAAADPVVMLYTSGTTGLPKGAVHTHSFLGPLVGAGARINVSDEDCVVLYLPLFHVYALFAGLLLMLANGAKVVLMERFRSLDSLRLMEREGSTIVYGVPTTYIDQLNDPTFDDVDLGKVRLAFTPLALDLCQRVKDRFATTCLNTFGMTETASIALIPAVDAPPEVAMGTVGQPIDSLEVKIVDEATGDEVPPGSSGALLLRGPSIMSYYHDKPAETSAAFDAAGWFKTGDVAIADAAGNLQFVGRRGDHYRVGGEAVDPIEVEAVLQSYPGVIRAAAVGVADERLGHVGYAWVMADPESGIDVADLVDFARTRLAPFKVPRKIMLIDELPTTPSGKVQKFRLLELPDVD